MRRVARIRLVAGWKYAALRGAVALACALAVMMSAGGCDLFDLDSGDGTVVDEPPPGAGACGSSNANRASCLPIRRAAASSHTPRRSVSASGSRALTRVSERSGRATHGECIRPCALPAQGVFGSRSKNVQTGEVSPRNQDGGLGRGNHYTNWATKQAGRPRNLGRHG